MDFTTAQTKEIQRRAKKLAAMKFRTMKEFYTASEVSSPLFSQYGTGKTPTSLQAVNRMARALEIPVDDLLDGIDQVNEPPATQPGDGLTDAQRELMSLIPTMTPGEVSVLLATAKAQAETRIAQDDRR